MSNLPPPNLSHLITHLPKFVNTLKQPSAHAPISRRKEFREKVGAKVRYFIGVSQRTRTDF